MTVKEIRDSIEGTTHIVLFKGDKEAGLLYEGIEEEMSDIWDRNRVTWIRPEYDSLYLDIEGYQGDLLPKEREKYTQWLNLIEDEFSGIEATEETQMFRDRVYLMLKKLKWAIRDGEQLVPDSVPLLEKDKAAFVRGWDEDYLKARERDRELRR